MWCSRTLMCHIMRSPGRMWNIRRPLILRQKNDQENARHEIFYSVLGCSLAIKLLTFASRNDCSALAAYHGTSLLGGSLVQTVATYVRRRLLIAGGLPQHSVISAVEDVACKYFLNVCTTISWSGERKAGDTVAQTCRSTTGREEGPPAGANYLT